MHKPGKLAGLIAFVAIGAVLHGLLSITYAKVVGPAHRAAELDSEFFASDEPLDVLVAGGSHARSAIDPKFLGNAMNVAVGGEHYIKSLYRLRYLLDESGRDVDTIVIPMDINGFSSWRSDSYDPEYVWGRYVDFAELGAVKGRPFLYARMWTKARLVPYAGELETLKMMWAGTKAFKTKESIDARLAQIPDRADRRNGVEAATLHFEGHAGGDESLVWAFRTLIEELRGREIRVVLVAHPLSPGYSFTARKLGADDDLRLALISEVEDPGHVDFLDFERIYQREPTYFYDGDHLSKRGRLKFTALLRRQLVKLGAL